MLRGLRFKLTVAVLRLLGWKTQVGRDHKGHRYIAFMLKDGTKTPWLYAHVYLHNLPLRDVPPLP